jgi:putative NADH-flavin reductase
MNITIIGATRGIGKETMMQALEKEHNVTLLVRDSSRIKIASNILEIIVGDFNNYDSVKKSIAKADVIIVSVGMMPTRKSVSLFSKGTENIIKVLKETNRTPLLIVVTGIGAGDSEGHGSFVYNKISKPLFLKTIYDDKNKQEEMLKKEYRNWIIIRPGFLTNGAKTTHYKIYTNLEGVKAKKISRADVADFILNQANNPSYIGKTPLITY